MPDLPEEAVQAASEKPVDPAEVIEEALTLMGVPAPEDGATAILGILDERGMVVVSAEDLDIVINKGDKAVGWPRYSEACNNLRAALPERRTNGLEK